MTALLAIALILAAAVWLFGPFVVWATIITVLAVFATGAATVFGLAFIEGGP